MYISAKDSFEAFDKVITTFKNEFEVMKNKADEVLPKPVEVGSYPSIGKFAIKFNNDSVRLDYPSYWFKKHTYYSSNLPMETLDEVEKRKQELSDLINKYEAECKLAIEQNQDAIKHNQKIIDKVKLMMTHIGVSSTYQTSEFKTSRSRTRTTTTHMAGFVGDLNRVIKTHMQGSYTDPKSLRERLQKEYEAEVKRVNDILKEKVKAEIAKKEVHELALLRAKYTPNDAMSSAMDILYVILDKNKYLNLAHYLQENRNDWNDGCSYAERGLDGFIVESDIDKEIEKELQEIIYNWHNHQDGRHFRDCKYNYNVIYSMVADKQLMADYERIVQLTH